MRFSLLTLVSLLFFLGCGPELSAPLHPKLSKYETSYTQCTDFLKGKSELTSDVETGCDQFVKRLDQVNKTANELESSKLKKGERQQKKILYVRQLNRMQLQYKKLSEAVKEGTLQAIEDDNEEKFLKGIAFPGNIFITPYYDYMKSKSPKYDNNKQLLAYQKEESKRLMSVAYRQLKQGKKAKALATFEKSANLGNALAARQTGKLYEKRNPSKAIEWHQKAVDGGIKASYLNLGRLYEAKGQKDVALEWYLKAANDNNAKAQYQLYTFFKDSSKNKALSWLDKAAEANYPPAQYTYGVILLEEGNVRKGIDLLQQSSQSNYVKASDFLGQYYYDHKLYARAFKLLAQSKTATSYYLQAKMFEEGAGVAQDYRKAYSLYTRAVVLGKSDAQKDIDRITGLLSKEQHAMAMKESEILNANMKTMIKECGVIPDTKKIKKRNKKFHISGVASAPVGKRSFIIYGDDGEDYYLLKAKNIKEDDRVNISVLSTGSTAVITSDDEDSTDIYQFTYLKECVLPDEE